MGPSLLSLALAPALLVNATSVEHGNAGTCSMAEFRMVRDRSSVAFLGTSAADTVAAGPGVVRYVRGRGHFSSGRAEPSFHGQVARVQRLEREAPAGIRDALRRTDSTVVLVPWDYGPDCTPVPWGRSAHWLPPGTSGLFFARLREPAHWVGGRPTLDVFSPGTALYLPSRLRRARMESGGESMSPEEYLALYELLPDFESLRRAPDSAAALVRRWADGHPDLARKVPAPDILRYLRFVAEEHRYTSRPSPLAGTYRFVFRTSSGDSAVVFARTRLEPTSVIRSRPVGSPDPQASGDGRGIGYYLLAYTAATIAGLPAGRPGPEHMAVGREGYLAVLDSPLVRTADSSVFAASVDLERAAVLFAPDAAARVALEQAAKQKEEFQSALFRRNEPSTPGRVVLTRDGRVRFEVAIGEGSVPALAIRGERLSRDHAIDPNPYSSPR